MFDDAHELDVDVVAINGATTLGGGWGPLSELPKPLTIEMVIEEDSYEELDQLLPPTITDMEIECNSDASELELSWTDIDGAVEYELEWAYVDDYPETPGGTAIIPTGAYCAKFDLVGNATRVLIPIDRLNPDPRYRLPLVYDRGYIVYRVRAVGRSFDQVDRSIYGPWSGPSSGCVGDISPDYYTVVSHDVNKNWQYAATYAEGGKRKDVVTYADGTTRSRQVVTRQNSNDLVIVGETIYDRAGRPAVQTLPVPVVKDECSEGDHIPLQYVPEFNMNTAELPLAPEAYSWLDFDLHESTCLTTTGEMSQGSAYYYSSQYASEYTSLPTDFVLAPDPFIPESYGYPFTQVEFTPDKTGRKRRESGVGPDHKLGPGDHSVESHETEYYYGKPDQLKLDRLFGSEAGYAAHYHKNVVVDPNGQVSVSYMDRWGRVVATALSGPAPDNLDELIPAAEAIDMTADLFECDADGNSVLNRIDDDQSAIVFESQLLVSFESVHTFDYTVEFPELSIECLADEICFHCVYDLSITITDQCGVTVWTEEQLVGNFDTVGDAPLVIFNCTGGGLLSGEAFTNEEPLPEPPLEPLAIGSYTITKVLTINESARQQYLEAFLSEEYMDPDCYVSLAQLIIDHTAAVDSSDCGIGCEECVTLLGTRQSFIANQLGDGALWQQLVDECNAPCRAPSWCEAAYDQMLTDMLPDGQYGKVIFNATTNSYEAPAAEEDQTSVYAPDNILRARIGSSTADWREPMLEINGQIRYEYLDLDNIRTPIAVIPTGPGTYLPEVTVAYPGATPGTFYAWPEDLVHLNDFIVHRQAGWERSLIYLHPEYCYYKECKAFAVDHTEGEGWSSDEFDALLLKATYLTDAVSEGLVNLGATLPNDKVINFFDLPTLSTHPFDPFAYDHPDGAQLTSRFNAYTTIGTTITMAEAAAVICRCPSNFGTSPSAACKDFLGPDGSLTSTEEAALHEREWTTFKALYLGTKYTIQKNYIDDQVIQACSCAGLNHCIGNDNFSHVESGMLWPVSEPLPDGLDIFLSQPWNKTCQPCSQHYYTYFTEKTPRFITPEDLPGMNMSVEDLDYQHYLATGQCPRALGLQLMLTDLAADGDLLNTGVGLQDNPGFVDLFLTDNNNVPPGPVPAHDWSSSIIGSEILGIISDGTTDCKIYLTEPSGLSSWNDVVSFSNLQSTGIVSGEFTFTVEVVFEVSPGMTQTATIAGRETCWNIRDCVFEPNCTGNILSSQLTLLMSGLASVGELDASTIAIDNDFAPVVGVPLRSLMGSPANLEWKFTPGFGFVLQKSSGGYPVLQLNLISADPSTFDLSTDVGLIRSVSNMRGAYNNFFLFDAYDVSGNFLATIRGQGWIQLDEEEIEPLEFGPCELPVSNACATLDYRLMDLLFGVIRERFIANGPLIASGSLGIPVDIFQSPLMVEPLFSMYVSTDPEEAPQTYLDGFLEGDNVCYYFEKYHCPVVCFPSESVPDLAYLDDISDPVLVGPQDENGFYHTITATAYFGAPVYASVPISIQVDCLNMLPCNPCPPEPPEEEEEEEFLRMLDDSTLLAQGHKVLSGFVEDYPIYKEVVAELNDRLGYDEVDSLFVPTFSFEEMSKHGWKAATQSYIRFLRNYNPKVDSPIALYDLSSFVIDYGYATNVKKEFERYLSAIADYNLRADTLNFDTLIPVEWSVFQELLAADSLHRYVSYLADRPQTGGAAQNLATFLINGDMIPEGDLSCDLLYTLFYLPAYADFEARQGALLTCKGYEVLSPLYSISDFYEHNLCCSDTGQTLLWDYIASLEDTTICPNALPQLKSCPGESLAAAKYEEQDCEKAYTYFHQTVKDYGESPYGTGGGVYLDPDLYASFEEFEKDSLCDCIEAYTSYLLEYIALPAFVDTPEVAVPLTIKEFDCESLIPVDPCLQQFADYKNAIDRFNDVAFGTGGSVPLITSTWSYVSFVEAGLCNCTGAYVAMIDYLLSDDELTYAEIVANGFEYDITKICSEVNPCPPMVITDIEEQTVDGSDCIPDLLNNARNTAIWVYNQWLDSISQVFYDQYTSQCLSAFETFTDEYQDKEYHYTLYYYDQAGNLIKTIPPAGVEELDITSPTSDAAIAVRNDRTYGNRTVYNDHRMASHYTFNSLQQPVRQDMPDHDKMAMWETHKPQGLPQALRITGSQFPTSTRGYLSGWLPGPGAIERGMAFSSDDGGRSWERLNGLIGADLYDVCMVDADYGYAVGDHGVVLHTSDGSNSWDLFGSYGSGLQHLRTVAFKDNLAGIVLGLGGHAAVTTTGANGFTLATVPGTVADFTGITYAGSGAYWASGNAQTGGFGLLHAITADGATWTTPKERFQVGSDLTAVRYYAAGSAYAVGKDGALLHTLSNGLEWDLVNTHMGKIFKDVFFLNVYEGVAIVDGDATNGEIWRTADAGHTWTLLGVGSSTLDRFSICSQGSSSAVLLVAGGELLSRIYIETGTAFGIDPLPDPRPEGSTQTIVSAAGRMNGDQLVVLVSTNDGFVHLLRDADAISPTWNSSPTAGAVFHHLAFEVFPVPPGSAVAGVGLNASGSAFSFHMSNTNIWSTSSASGTYLDLELDGANDMVYALADVGDLHSTSVTNTLPGALINGTTTPATVALSAIALSPDQNTMLACGEAGALFEADVSTLPATWTDYSKEVRPLGLHAVAFNSTTSEVIAVGERGMVVTPQQILLNGDVLEDLRGVDVMGSSFVACGDEGSLYTLTLVTDGYTETDLASPVTTDLFAISVEGTQVEASGANGLLLRSPTGAPGSFEANTPPAGAMRGIDHLPGSTEVVAVGDDAAVHRHVGLFRLVVKDLFVPKANDIHFANATDGYLIADRYTVRHTADGGMTWKTVVPSFSAGSVLLNQVHTYAPGEAFAVGQNKQLSKISGEAAVAISLSCGSCGTMDLRDIAISPGGKGVIVGSLSNVPYYFPSDDLSFSTAGIVSTGGGGLNAVWNFGNDNFLMAGNKIGSAANIGIIRASDWTDQDWINFDNGITPSSVFDITDIFFHDLVVGYIVTSNGQVYHTTRENPNEQTELNWKPDRMNTDDDIDGQSDTELMAISTISFATRTQGFMGGSYDCLPGMPQTDPMGYARLVLDEAELNSSRFWYDRLGRLVLSQNTKQFDDDGDNNEETPPDRYSYTLYDVLGRVVEAGEVEQGAAPTYTFADIFGAEVNGMLDPLAIDDAALAAFVNDPANIRRDMTRTLYDGQGTGSPPGLADEHLRLRVAATYHWDEYDEPGDDDASYDHATHYSYDIHGNVKTLVQDMPHLVAHAGVDADHRYKQMDYTYELLSGNVLGVSYQSGQVDQYHHRYAYDADNRLEYVETSREGLIWERDAEYFYYAHGPLKRVEIGERNVQGLDYAYTLQGWLKGMNSNWLQPENDMGNDGLASHINQYTARDAYGLTLGYYTGGVDGDYKAIDDNRWDLNPADRYEAKTTSSYLLDQREDLWNGNIGHLVSTLPDIASPPSSYTAGALGTAYRYDQLNRLVDMWAQKGLDADNDWTMAGSSPANLYHAHYDFDAMGNIEFLERYDQDATPQLFDNLAYHYQKDSEGHLVRNRLYHLNDEGDDTFVQAADGPADIEEFTAVAHPFNDVDATINTVDNNYRYDAMGNLIYDKREGITDDLDGPGIEWTANGKVRSVKRPTGVGHKRLNFAYDGTGQRTRKFVLEDDGTTLTHADHYVRDAQGNIMAIYKFDMSDAPTASLSVSDRPLYGSARLGVDDKKLELLGVTYPADEPTELFHQVGLKQYELSDHLGNVHVTVTDQHLAEDGATADDVTEWYSPQILTAQDYYPFGSLLPGRNYSSDEYRFGFNGQEKDDEVNGSTGTSYDFGARMQDPRTGRFWSIDPAASKLPGVSVYAYGANNPIAFVDYNGEFPISIHVRSFAPFDYFGVRLWKGDNRGFSTNASAKSRISQITAYETETMTSFTRPVGAKSSSRYGAKAWSDAFVVDKSLGNRIETHLYGDNDALIPGLDYGGPTSDIDIWTDVFISTTSHDDGSSQLTIKGGVKGDQFPSAEAFVSDDFGNSVFLGAAPALAGPNEGPFWTLIGDAKKDMMQIDVSIEVDKDGRFTGVRQGDSVVGLDDWNKRFERTPPAARKEKE